MEMQCILCRYDRVNVPAARAIKAGASMLTRDVIVGSMVGMRASGCTFQTFGLHSGNRFAHAAAVAVAEAPGQAHNPLLLRGGRAEDRTHLLHAIGNHAQELHPSLAIHYVRAEEFRRQPVDAPEDYQHDDLGGYADTGMLLVDNVQLLPCDGAVQADLFRLFALLHSGGRQLVISCDHAPANLSGLDRRLRDWLTWGLVVELTDGAA